MTRSEFCSRLESMLELEPGTIKGEELLQELPGWDSMAVLSFIAMADSELGQSVQAKALSDCHTVGDLAALFPGQVE